jgi:dCMP deaminase
MQIARVVASRSTCLRVPTVSGELGGVGAVIVRQLNILATGYNGSVRSLPHCTEDGHMMEDGHCRRTAHAEANAIVQAARHGVAIEGATMYTTASPCWDCFKLIANAGIVCIKYGRFYRDPRSLEAAEQLGIKLELVE